MTSKVTYLGDLRTSSVHIQSGTEIISDAPLDNNGKGEAFSPTDSVANALATCMMTIMGIKSRDLNIDLKGSIQTQLVMVQQMFKELKFRPLQQQEDLELNLI